MMFLLPLLALSVGCQALATQQVLLEESAVSGRKPNFLFILTDDQDLRMNSPAYMPRTQAKIKDKGTEFQNHFVTTSLCCPSRVSLWTGRQAHNTNVTDVKPPYGRYLRPFPVSVAKLMLRRRIPQIRRTRVQRELPPRLAAVRRLQHLLHG